MRSAVPPRLEPRRGAFVSTDSLNEEEFAELRATLRTLAEAVAP